MNNLHIKLDNIIKDLLKDKFVLAFSGGVDSALILKLASKFRREENDVVAMFFYALSTTDEELENAKILAKKMNVKLIVKEVDILTDENIINNAKDRCFHCKSLLFKEAIKLKDELGYGSVVDGTNTDDHKVYRPGLKALKSLGVVSPLNMAGLSKADVRDYAAKLNLEVSKKPSAPCLLTRFPYGAKITKDKLKRVEAGESFLRGLGLEKFRLRDHEGLARLEIQDKDLEKVLAKKDDIINKLKDLGYAYVTLDLEGFRSGSMDEVLSAEEKRKWSL